MSWAIQRDVIAMTVSLASLMSPTGTPSLLSSLTALAAMPDLKSPEYNAWVDQGDFVDFLKNLKARDEVVLYADSSFYFLYAVAVPTSELEPAPVDDLLMWNCNPCSSWGVWIGYSKGAKEPDVGIDAPLANCGAKVLERGEQLLFLRRFDGIKGDGSYIELSQKVAHILGIHHMADRNAYCRIDENGDVEDVVRIQSVAGGRLVSIKRPDLEYLLALLKSSYVLLFDSTRYDSANFNGWGKGEETRIILNEEAIYYRFRSNPGRESYLRGFQIISPILDEGLRRRLRGEPGEPMRYATFIANDWKNKRVEECSCDPSLLGNYFVSSDLPYETSPAFFRPEVLLKYKQDPDKYIIEQRSIHCKGAWFLKSFDINNEGQIHAYLCDLNKLPYSEQLYWKSFNEFPKETISNRAFQSDFLAQWSTTPDPLGNLRRRLEELAASETAWWKLKDRRLLERVHYPVTTSQKEWSDELLALNHLVIEGINREYFKARLETSGAKVDPQWGSITLVDKVLECASVNAEKRTAIVDPLKHLQLLRNKMKGHAEGSLANKIRDELIQEFGDLRVHFRKLAERCDKAIALMIEFTSSGIF